MRKSWHFQVDQAASIPEVSDMTLSEQILVSHTGTAERTEEPTKEDLAPQSGIKRAVDALKHRYN